MQRIATVNRSLNLFGAGKDGFRAGNIALGIEATSFSDEWCNGVQEELANVIEGQGLVLAANDRTQLRQAITKMIQSGNRTVVIDAVTFAPAVTTSGQVVYWDNANARFDLAIADGTDKQNTVGVADLAATSVVAFGDATLFAGLTPGGRYYLSAATAGAMTTVKPSLNAIFVGVARTATEVFIDIDFAPAGVATGTLIYVPANVAPAGYIKANGALLSRATYADLLAYGQGSGNMAANDGAWTEGQFSPGDGATTFRIPDGRGRIVRAWDDGRGIDTGRALGSSQAGSIQSNYHQIQSGGLGSGAIWATGDTPGSMVATVNLVADGTETRPANIAWLACIKY